MGQEQAQIMDLDFPECVRKRKEMYIYSKEHMIYEIIDNSIDEASSGYADAIAVAIVKNDEGRIEVTVEDNGRGIPVTLHPKQEKFKGLTQAEVAFSVLHAGGKFDGKGYKTAGGLHGVGASCVNALSEYLRLTIQTSGKEYIAEFEKGFITNHLRETGKVKTTGTLVTFKYDLSMWDNNDSVEYLKVQKRLKQLAFLNPGVSFYFYVQIDDVKIEETYCEADGLKSYVTKILKKKSPISIPIGTTTSEDDDEVSIALAYTSSYNEDIMTFCNNIPTEDGGDHLTGFKQGVSKAINDYAVVNKFIKEDESFETSDTLDGIVGITSIKVKDPKFVGQSKTQIKMPNIRAAVKKTTEKLLYDYLDANPNEAKIIINKIMLAKAARQAAQKARETARKSKSLTGDGPPAKLADCSESNPELCEIFFVEGDSAAGSAKQGRSRKYQAILPVFGKIQNTERVRLLDVIDNVKIREILAALKCGIGEEFDISKLRYHKIIIMSDKKFVPLKSNL